MFRILKLEDRIVLDAAFGDALEDHHEQDVLEAVVGEQNDGNDNSDHGADDGNGDADGQDLYAVASAYQTDPEGGVHVLVVSSDVYEADDLVAAAHDDVIVVQYDSKSSLDDLSVTIKDALDGQKADSIAFATHNAGDAKVQLTDKDVASAESIDTDLDQKVFWKSIGGMLDKDGRIDLLACKVQNGEDGEHLLSGIEHISKANVAASTNYTGSEAYGGDWVLESKGVDVGGTYFDSDRIKAYQGVLNQDVIPNGSLFDQSAQAGNFWAYALPAGTFVDPNPGPNPIDYTFSVAEVQKGSDGVLANTAWIKFYEPTQVFYGTPPVGSAEGDIYTITLQASDETGNFTNAAELSFDLTLADTGQHVPVYNNPALIKVPEYSGTPAGTEVGEQIAKIVASDADSQPLTYEVIDGGDIFAINNSGVLTLKDAAGAQLFDYETSGATNHRFTVTLKATDPDGLSDTAQATIEVSNIEPEATQGLPTVSLEIQGNAQISENGGTTLVNAVLTGETQGESLSVSVLFPANDPDLGADYTASGTEIIIPAGATQGTTPITLTGLTDTITPETETISMSIDPAGVSNYIAGTQAADVAILDVAPGPNPKVSLFPSTFNLAEGDLLSITAQLDTTATQNVTVYLDFSDPSGSVVTPEVLAVWAGTDGSVPDADFGSKDSITIFQGTASNKISLTGFTDLLNENDEKIVITLDQARTVDADPGLNPQQTVTLIDNTPPEIELSATPSPIYEDTGAGPKSAIVTASVLGGETLTANATVFINMGGTAIETSDFTITGTDGVTPIAPTVQGGENTYKLIIPAGSSSGSIQVNAVADGVYDGSVNDVIEATVFSATGVIDGGTPELATVEIVDMDQASAPTVNLSIGSSLTAGTFTESTSLTLNVNLDKLSPQATVTAAVDVSEIVGIPQPELGVDYTAKIGTQDVTVDANGRLLVNIEPGFTRTSVTLAGVTDTVFEGLEEAQFSISEVTSGIVGTQDMVDIGIEDLNAAPTITLSSNETDIYENPTATDGSEPDSAELTITVAPGDPIANPLTVNLTPSAATALGEAEAGSDYIVKDSGGQTLALNADGEYELIFTAGETGAVLTLEATDDIFPEGDESFSMDFSADTQAKYNTTGNPVNLTIFDDEDPPTGVTVSLATDAATSIDEDGGVSTLTIELSEPLSGNQTVDFDLGGSTAKLGPGDQWTPSTPVDMGDFVVPTSVNGYFFEAISTDTETTDASEPIWPTVFEGTVSDNGVIWQNRGRYDYVLQDADGGYLFSTAGTVTIPIPQGETAVDVTLTSLVDNLFEGTAGEDVAVQLANPSWLGMLKTPDSASVNIQESLNAPGVFLNVSNSTMAENGGAVQIIAELEHLTTEDVFVNLAYSSETGTDLATINDDYVVVGDTIQIEAGFTSNSTGVQAVDDKILEPNETFKVSIADATGGGVVLSTDPTDIEEILTIIDDDANGNPQVMLRFADGADTATFSENDGTTTLNVTLDRPVNATVGVQLDFSTAGVDFANPEVDYSVDGYNLSTNNPIQLVLNPNQTEASFVLRGLDDLTREGDELATVSLGAITGGDAGKLPEASPGFTMVTATVEDNEDPPQADLVWNVNEFLEGTSAKILVNLDRASDSTITIPLIFGSTEPNEATFTKDYLPTGGQTEIIVSAGATQGELKVFAFSGDAFELDETISVAIDTVNLTDDVDPGNDSDVVTILESSAKPEVSLTVTGTDVQESGGVSTLTVGLSSTEVTALEDIAVQINLNGLVFGSDADYTVDDGTTPITVTGNSFTYTFTEGAAATKDFTLTFIDDSETTGDQTLFPRIDSASLPTSVVDTTPDVTDIIVRDDEFTVQTVTLASNPVPLIINEESPGSFFATPPGIGEIKIGLSGNVLPGGALVVLDLGGVAEPGVDYVLALDEAFTNSVPITADGTAEITMIQGVTQESVFIKPVADDLFEGGTAGEPFSVGVNYVDSDNLSTGGADTLTGSVYEEDAPPVISLLDGVPTSIIEGTQGVQGTGTITLQLDAASFQDTTVDMQVIQTSTDGAVADWPSDFTLAVQAGLDAPDWQAGTYALGDYVTNSAGDEFFRAVDGTDADTSGSFESGTAAPIFPGGAGSTIQDGELVWRNMGPISPVVTDGGGTVSDTFSVIVPAGETEFSLAVTPIDDGLKEIDELVILELAGTGGAAYSVDAAASDSTVIIEDDDVGPEFSFSFTDPFIDEAGATTGNLSLSLDGTSGADTTVTMSFSGGAIFAADIPWATDTVAVDDLITDGDHFYQAISGGTPGTAAPTFPVDGGTVADGTSGVEWQDLGTYDYLLGGLTDIDNWAHDTNTGIDTVDLLVPSGASTATYTIAATDDGIFEGDEQFTIDVSTIVGAENTLAETPVDVTIIDAQSGPTISLSTDSGTLAENGNLVLTFTSDIAVSVPTKIFLNTGATDTALDGTDYDVFATPGGTEGDYFVTLPAGETSVSLPLEGITDTIYEGVGTSAETFSLTIGDIKADLNGDGVEGTIGSVNATAGTFSGTMFDTSVKGEVSLSIDPVDGIFNESGEATEGGTATLSVVLTGGTSAFDEIVTLDFSTVAAVMGDDYKVMDGTVDVTPTTDAPTVDVTITAGASEASLTLEGLTDSISEGDEDFTIGLGTVGATMGIQNADTVGDTVTATIEDFTPAPTVTLDLTTPYGGTDTGSEPDTNDVLFWEGTGMGATAEETTAILTLSLDRANEGQDVLVPLDFSTAGAVMGVDYEVLSGTDGLIAVDSGASTVDVTIPAGATEATVILQAIDDPTGTPAFEGDLDLSVTLVTEGLNGAQPIDSTNADDFMVSATILDDEEAPEVALHINSLSLPDNEFVEGNGSAWVTATLDQATNRPVTVTLDLGFTDSVAVKGVDYSAQPSNLIITIPEGATIGSNQVNLAGLPDSIYEGDEAFKIGIADVTNARPAQPLDTWGSDTDYEIGDRIADSGFIFEVTTDNGSSGTSGPAFTGGADDLFGETIADGGLIWTNQGLEDISTFPAWGPEADVVVGDEVAPGNGFYYVVTDAGANGQTGLNQPTWTETPGSTVVDNGVVWTNQGQGAPQPEVMGVVVEDDIGPTASISVSPISGEIAEEGGIATITVSLTGAEINPDVAETVYLSYPVDPTDFEGTHIVDWDLYSDTAGATKVGFRNDILGGESFFEVTIPAGQTATEVYLKSIPDGIGSAGIYEPDETVTLGIADFANGTLQTNTAAEEVTVTIIDDDLAAAKNVSLSFDSPGFVGTADVAETEGGSTLTFYVNLDGPSNGDVKTTINIDGGMVGDSDFAEYGADFTVPADTDGDGQITVTVTAGATSAPVGITILNDDMFEGPETIDISLDTAGVIGGLVATGQDAITGTITDDADTPEVFIYVSNDLAEVTGYESWVAATEFNPTDTVAPDNGFHYDALTVGTSGAIEPEWPTVQDAIVVDGDAGGLTWDGNETYDAWAAGVTFVGGTDLLVTATTGATYLFDVNPGGLAGFVEPDWASAPNIGDSISELSGTVYTNLGEVQTVWAPGDTIQAGDLIATGGYSYKALDDGTTGLTEPVWPASVDGFVRDGDTAVVWQNQGPIDEFDGTVDETDEDIIGPFFVIEKTNATDEILTVKWEIDSTATDAAVPSDGGDGPFDYATQPLGQTSGQVFLGKDAFQTQGIPINILGDQFDELNSDLTIKITDVLIGTESFGTDPVTNEAATLTITDDVADLQPDGSTLPPDATPESFVNDGLDDTELLEGGTATIGTLDLEFTDADHPDTADILYTVTVTPTAGTLFLDANQDGILDAGEEITAGTEGVSTFTQMDIDDGKLLYQHNGGETLNDEFKFHVSDPAPNTSYEDPDATAGPVDWTFGITARAVNDLPVFDGNVFWVNDEVSGKVWADPNGTADGAPLATDAEGDPLVFQVMTPDGTWENFDVFPNFELDPTTDQLVVTLGEELNWEIQSSHTLHIRVTDNFDPGPIWQDDYFVVFVNEPTAKQFDTGVDITPAVQTIDSDNLYIFQIPNEVFIDASIVTYGYSATSSLGGGATLLDWLYFNQETQTFVFNPLEPSWPAPPTVDQVFTIEVTATYWHENFPVQPKGEVIKTFDIDYDYIASLETGMLQNALDYLEGDSNGDLQLDGDGVEIQELMVARADFGMVAQADGVEPQMDSELTDVLALLEGEVFLGEPVYNDTARDESGDVDMA